MELQSVSPANGKTLARYERMSERDVKDAIDNAHAAYS
jgi:acyl-CoA reductase-like NAD-dependent aldehyde dehydrogenase